MTDSETLIGEEVETDEEVREELATLYDFHKTEDLNWVLSDVRGRRFIWGLLEEAGVFNSSFDGTEIGTVFNEGNRAYGLKVLDLIMAAQPEVFTQMIKEKEDYERHITQLRENRREQSGG